MYVHKYRYMYANDIQFEKEVVWLGDILWKGSMEFSSHRGFITPNVSAADCYLRQWYDYKECVRC